MYINVEIPKVSNSKTINDIAQALNSEPVQHNGINCGYNTISVSYNCSKNDQQIIKNHWKANVPGCIVVSM